MRKESAAMILSICANPSIDILAGLKQINAGESHRIEWEKRYPGGKGLHVALGLAELGEPVTVLGFWGGPTGQWLRSESERRGVRVRGPWVAEWNRTCYTFSSDGAFNDTEILGVGPKVSSNEVRDFMTEFEELLPQVQVLSMSGSISPGAPVDLYAQMIRKAHARGVPTLVDCTGESLLAALAEKPTGIHLNLSETQKLTGESNIEKASRFFSERRVFAALTAGADGLYFSEGSNRWHGRVQIQPTASAIGSGDCLVAGLAFALKGKLGPEAAVRWGVACGAANCLREDLGMFHKRTVDELYGQVEVRGL